MESIWGSEVTGSALVLGMSVEGEGHAGRQPWLRRQKHARILGGISGIWSWAVAPMAKYEHRYAQVSQPPSELRQAEGALLSAGRQ